MGNLELPMELHKYVTNYSFCVELHIKTSVDTRNNNCTKALAINIILTRKILDGQAEPDVRPPGAASPSGKSI